MNDFSTASMESAAPADSGVSIDTPAAASSTGAPESVSPTQPVDAMASTPADDSIDVGWTFEDETDGNTGELPEDDADLESLTQDPALDPERTPALVENLRNLRRDFRKVNGEYKALSQQAEAFAPYGGVDGALGLLKTFDDLAYRPAEAALPFLQHLSENAFPAYSAIAETLVEQQADWIIDRLQQTGKLPAQLSQPTTAIDPDTLASIPQHLQETYKRQPDEARAELDLMSETARNHFLEREAKLDQLDAQQRQQAEQQWQQQVETARYSGMQAVEQLSQQFEQAHYQQLAKWSPFGTEDQASNQALYSSIVEGAFAQLLSDPKFAQLHADSVNLLRNAPLRTLYGEGMAAQQDAIKARQNAAQFNARLGQVIKAQVQKLDAVFRDARAYREIQRQAAPQRTEIPGQSTQINSNIRSKALNANGKISNEYLENLARQISLGR